MCFAQSNGNFLICYGCPYDTAYGREERCQAKKAERQILYELHKIHHSEQRSVSPDIWQLTGVIIPYSPRMGVTTLMSVTDRFQLYRMATPQ